MIRLLFLSLLSVVVAGCGPKESPADREKRETQKRVERDVVDLAPLAGHYVGNWTSGNGESYPAAIDLYIGRELRKIAPSKEPIEVPTFAGSIFLTQLQDARKLDMSLGEVVTGRYVPATGSVTFLLGPVPGARSGDDLSREFNGTLKAGVLKARFPVNGRLSSITARKVVQ